VKGSLYPHVHQSPKQFSSWRTHCIGSGLSCHNC